MGASFGTQQKKGDVNVELNIVPFIDLMSCLTAFLLVTAVWVNMSSLQNEPVGRGKVGGVEQDKTRLGVLIEHDQMVVSAFPSGQTVTVASNDWARLEDALRGFRTGDVEPAVEVAGASSDAHPISYQTVMAAMDTAQKVGYERVGVVDPANLGR